MPQLVPTSFNTEESGHAGQIDNTAKFHPRSAGSGKSIAISEGAALGAPRERASVISKPSVINMSALGTMQVYFGDPRTPSQRPDTDGQPRVQGIVRSQQRHCSIGLVYQLLLRRQFARRTTITRERPRVCKLIQRSGMPSATCTPILPVIPATMGTE